VPILWQIVGQDATWHWVALGQDHFVLDGSTGPLNDGTSSITLKSRLRTFQLLLLLAYVIKTHSWSACYFDFSTHTKRHQCNLSVLMFCGMLTLLNVVASGWASMSDALCYQFYELIVLHIDHDNYCKYVLISWVKVFLCSSSWLLVTVLADCIETRMEYSISISCATHELHHFLYVKGYMLTNNSKPCARLL